MGREQRKSKTSKTFFLKKHWFRAGVFLLLALIFLFLPGQNIYEMELAVSEKSLINKLPMEAPKIAPYPENKTGVLPPPLTAKAALVLDLPSQVVLYQKNPNLRLSPASTTKIMTALVAFENYALNQILTVKKVETRGRTMGLVRGEKITVESLLYGTLVHSGNDAAFTLAENDPEGIEGFVKKMNEKAKKLHLLDTNFDNPVGFESPRHFSSALDLARLAIFALKNKNFDKIVGTPSITVHDTTFTFFHYLLNVNELLGKIPGVAGVKTGFTENAGECLINLVERDGKKILTVILGSEDRFEESKLLLNWAFANHQWVELKPINNPRSIQIQ